jgi:hypothetical protein
MQNFEEFLQQIKIFILEPELLSPELQFWLFVFKIIFLVFGFFFLGFTIWALIFTSWLKRAILQDLKEFLTFKPFEAQIFLPKWKKIKERIASGIEAELKLAILEADSLLDQFLKRQGYKGETLEEKLELLTEDILSNINEVKEAIKVKRAIIEDPSYRLSFQEAKKTLSIYERALKDLQAI